jgi:hypothetical protein
LAINSDAPLTLPGAFEGLQPVARQRGKVLQALRRIQPIKPRFGLSRNTGEFQNVFAISERHHVRYINWQSRL